MPSIESKLFYHLLRFINKKRFLEMQFTFGRFDFYNCKEPPKEIYKICNVDKNQFMGRNVFTLCPKKDRVSASHILYLHGGAYVQNFVKQHWRFLAMLVRETHCTVTAPDYPLAPEYTYRDAFEMLVPLYQRLLSKVEQGNSILMGDSAGGGLALALAQKLKVERLPPPQSLILLSPWLDIALNNPEIKAIDRFDPFLSVKGLRKAGLAYAGQSNIDGHMLSPINGPLEQVGDISVFIGSRDLLVADARKLKVLGAKKGIAINYREYKDMVHVWMFLGFPEAKLAQKEIFNLIIDKDNARSS